MSTNCSSALEAIRFPPYISHNLAKKFGVINNPKLFCGLVWFPEREAEASFKKKTICLLMKSLRF
jgi:hypothetical protein